MLILASQSPQRREILEKLGISFEVIPSDFDESQVTEQDPISRAKLLATAKAKEVAEKYPNRWVIGVDTLVVSEDGELLEKPVDVDDVRRMLRLHSGKTSAVHSAICLMRCVILSGLPGEARAKSGARASDKDAEREVEGRHTDLSTAHVTFRNLTDEIIEQWIDTGLWKERSGAFQIELPEVKLAEELEKHPLICGLQGEFETVVGFPVEVFKRMIR